MTEPGIAGVPACTDESFASERTRTCGGRSGWRTLSVLACLILLACISVTAQTNTTAEWPETEARLTQLLSGNSEQKRTALAEIRNLRSEPTSRLALPSLSDPDELVRATAASSVVFLPASEARSVLLPLLDDKRPFVRREAAYALGFVEDWGATNRLRRLLINDRDLEVRAAAAIAIGNIGDPSAIEDLLKSLDKRPKEDEEFLRRSAARAIGQIFELRAMGSTQTLTPQNFLPPKYKELGQASTASDPVDAKLLQAAMLSLSKVLRNSEEADDTRREAAFALGALRQPASAALLRGYLSSADPYLVEISKEALLKIENQ